MREDYDISRPHDSRAPRSNRIAVGVDFSSTSDLATDVAADLATKCGIELLLIHVCAAAPLGISPQLTLRYDTVLHEQLSAARHSLRERCSELRARGVLATAEVVVGTPHRDLGATASARGASLLVIGTHGRTGIRRLIMGSVAERTVRTSPIDTLVARGRPTAYRNILVPTDFSLQAERALALAVQLVEPGGVVQLIHCCAVSPMLPAAPAEPSASLGGYYDLAVEAARIGANRLMARYSDQPEIRFINTTDLPTSGIQEELEHASYDLVVMGSNGRTGLERWIVGSVAETTVRHAPCSVLVVKDSPRASYDRDESPTAQAV